MCLWDAGSRRLSVPPYDGNLAPDLPDDVAVGIVKHAQVPNERLTKFAGSIQVAIGQFEVPHRAVKASASKQRARARVPQSEESVREARDDGIVRAVDEHGYARTCGPIRLRKPLE